MADVMVVHLVMVLVGMLVGNWGVKKVVWKAKLLAVVLVYL